MREENQRGRRSVDTLEDGTLPNMEETQEIPDQSFYHHNSFNFEDRPTPFGLNFMEMYPEALYNYTGTFPYDVRLVSMSDMNAPVLHTPQHIPDIQHTLSDIKAEEVTSTSSPLPNSEDKLDLTEFGDNQLSIQSSSSFLNTPPVLVVGLNPWDGDYNFRVSIPPASFSGLKPRVQPKYIFSELTNKLYVAKNKAFPVNITLDHYPVGATLVMCPVYTNPTHRMRPVYRCPNCSFADQNDGEREHVLQVEGSCDRIYFKDNNRCMVSLSLGVPAPGDNSVNIFLKLACNTSCVGGPNRRLFSIVFTLKIKDREIGRQVIHTKCCEGPVRDKKNEEAASTRSPQEDNDNTALIREISSALSNGKIVKKTKCLKEEKLRVIVAEEEYEMLSVPKAFSKQVKRYINTLYMKEEIKKLKLDISKVYPSEESD